MRYYVYVDDAFDVLGVSADGELQDYEVVRPGDDIFDQEFGDTTERLRALWSAAHSSKGKALARVVEAARELELRARSNRDHATMNGLRDALTALDNSA